MNVPMDKWGWDHWSTLAYLETCAVDHRGQISKPKMRCIHTLHPQHSHGHDASEYPTRLAGGELLYDHDDWSCAEDMEAAGVIEFGGTGLYPVVTFTDAGHVLAGLLRAHRANGGNWGDFDATSQPAGEGVADG